MYRVKPPPGTKGPFVPGRGFTRDKRPPPYIYLPFLRLPPTLGQFLISASLVPPPSPAPTASCSPPSLSRSAAVPRYQRTRRPSSAAPLRRQSRAPPSPSATPSADVVPPPHSRLSSTAALLAPSSSSTSASPVRHPELAVPTSPRAAIGQNGADRGPPPPRPPNPKFCANFSELGVNFIYYILSRIQLLELGANFVQILLEFNFGYIIRIQFWIYY